MNRTLNRLKFTGLFFIVCSLILFTASSCEVEEENVEVPPYDGPLAEAHDVVTLFSDSAQVRLRMSAPLQYEMQNHDREFPEGVMVEFFTAGGDVETVLEADYGKYESDSGVYQAKGNVVIENKVKREKLESEELFWDPETETIYTPTENEVHIETPTETLWGRGLEAKQDFSTYKILDLKGVITHDP